VIDYGVVRDTIVGAISPTGSTNDLAIEGEGYFVIETENGERYTRNGRFKIDAEGALVTESGKPVLDDGGNPIRLAGGETSFEVSATGTVSTKNGPIAQLAIVNFENEQELRMEGDSLYSSNAEPLPVEQARLMQGAIESSNVQPIVEMTQMMEVVRRYQSMAQLIQRRDEILRRAVETLAKSS
jgi:flagellar basal-body rod protein FlgF